MITYPIHSKMWSVLHFSIFLVSSFIEDFLFISFQQSNEIKDGKYPDWVQIFTFFWRQRIQKKFDRW